MTDRQNIARTLLLRAQRYDHVMHRRGRTRGNHLRKLHALCRYYELACLENPCKQVREDYLDSVSPTLREEILSIEAGSHEWNNVCTAFMKALVNHLSVVHLGEEYPASSWEETPRLLYRVQGEESHTIYQKRVGFLSERIWSRGRVLDVEADEFSDFFDHVNEQQQTTGTDIVPFESPYVSLTESPYRALRYAMSGAFGNSSETRIFALDPLMLKAANVTLARSSGIYLRYLSTKEEDLRPHPVPPPKNALPSHWLAEGWVPNDCLIEVYTVPCFKEICEENGIEFRGEDEPNLVEAEKRLTMESLCGRESLSELEMMEEVDNSYREVCDSAFWWEHP